MPDTLSKLITQPGASNDRAEQGRINNSLRKKNSNGWIKAHEQARDLVDAETYRKRIKVGMLQARLHKIAMGKVDSNPVAVAALKVLMDKALPTLQAVESSLVEPAITRSDPELSAALKEKMREVMLENPDWVQEVLGEQARTAAAQPELQPVDLADDAAQRTKDHAA